MAEAIKTVYTYPLDGTTTVFKVPFEYLARKFVRVTLIGTDRKVLTLNGDYKFSTPREISMANAWGPAQGFTTVEIRRYTSATERLVDYTDGSILRAYELNLSQIQAIHVAEEARDLTSDTISVNQDGQLDARGHTIVNVADAKDDTSAVNLGQVKAMSQGAWQARNEAEQFRNEAQDAQHAADIFAKNAAGSATAARDSATAAATSANASATSAQGSYENAVISKDNAAKALVSEHNASISANRAEECENLARKWASNPIGQVVADEKYSALHYADLAKTEAEKLKNWNDLAGAIDRVRGTIVVWKGRQVTPQFSVKTATGTGPEQPLVSHQLYQNPTTKALQYEMFANASKKRNDMYTFVMSDPATWPSGRSSGNGTHNLKGNVQVDGGDLGVSENLHVSGKATFGGEATFGKQIVAKTLYTQSEDGTKTIGLSSQAAAGRYSYLSIGDYKGEMASFYRSFENDPKVNFSVNGLVVSTSQFVSTDPTAKGTWAGDFSLRNGAFVWDAGDNTDWSSYIPLIKGYTRRSDGHPTTASFGMLTFSTPDYAKAVIRVASDHQDNTFWTFDLSGNLSLPHGKSWIADNGDIGGGIWGTSAKTYVDTTCKRKLGSTTPLYSGGGVGAGYSVTLTQDIRFRQCWFVVYGHWMPVSVAGDGLYYVSGWGDGWLKFRIENNGRKITNVEDKDTVFSAIYAMNE